MGNLASADEQYAIATANAGVSGTNPPSASVLSSGDGSMGDSGAALVRSMIMGAANNTTAEKTKQQQRYNRKKRSSDQMSKSLDKDDDDSCSSSEDEDEEECESGNDGRNKTYLMSNVAQLQEMQDYFKEIKKYALNTYPKFPLGSGYIGLPSLMQKLKWCEECTRRFNKKGLSSGSSIGSEQKNAVCGDFAADITTILREVLHEQQYQEGENSDITIEIFTQRGALEWIQLPSTSADKINDESEYLVAKELLQLFKLPVRENDENLSTAGELKSGDAHLVGDDDPVSIINKHFLSVRQSSESGSALFPSHFTNKEKKTPEGGNNILSPYVCLFTLHNASVDSIRRCRLLLHKILTPPLNEGIFTTIRPFHPLPTNRSKLLQTNILNNVENDDSASGAASEMLCYGQTGIGCAAIEIAFDCLTASPPSKENEIFEHESLIITSNLSITPILASKPAIDQYNHCIKYYKSPLNTFCCLFQSPSKKGNSAFLLELDCHFDHALSRINSHIHNGHGECLDLRLQIQSAFRDRRNVDICTDRKDAENNEQKKVVVEDISDDPYIRLELYGRNLDFILSSSSSMTSIKGNDASNDALQTVSTANQPVISSSSSDVNIEELLAFTIVLAYDDKWYNAMQRSINDNSSTYDEEFIDSLSDFFDDLGAVWRGCVDAGTTPLPKKILPQHTSLDGSPCNVNLTQPTSAKIPTKSLDLLSSEEKVNILSTRNGKNKRTDPTLIAILESLEERIKKGCAGILTFMDRSGDDLPVLDLTGRIRREQKQIQHQKLRLEQEQEQELSSSQTKSP